MFIRAYLRASTTEQDATRAWGALEAFACEHGHAVAARYIENESGAKAGRHELRRMLDDSSRGDIILIESVDRLSRLDSESWRVLRSDIDSKALRIVSLDLPTSHAAMTVSAGDEFTNRMLAAVNGMLLDMLAAIARKDYEQRRERQAQGIKNAKARGAFKGKPRDKAKRAAIAALLNKGISIRKTAKLAGCSTSTVQSVRAENN